MNSTVKVTIFCIVCLVLSIVFFVLTVCRKKDENTKLMIIQSLYNIPLAVTGITVNFIEPYDDPKLGLWILTMFLLLIPTVLGYLIFAFIMPVVKLTKKMQMPKAYWIYTVLLIAELIVAPFTLI